VSIAVADRLAPVKPSPTLAVTARAAERRAAGHDVIGLGAGEPDFDTPLHIKRAAVEAIERGLTKYTAVDGTAALKEAVQQKFQRENQLSYRPDQILVSAGGKQSFYNLCQALLNPGDEVLIPAPYWTSYPDIVKLADGVPVILTASIEQHFKITPEQLAGAIGPRTKMFVLNSPSNPTGAAYSDAELAALAGVLKNHPHVIIATDDMYEHIRWGNTPFRNILNIEPALYDHTVVLNGVSKAYSMTGWRIGYAAGPTALIKAMKKIQSQSTSNPCSISQAAAQAALTGDQSCIAEMVTAFKQRHDYVVASLNALPGVRCRPGDGTFYAFPDFRDVLATRQITDDVVLAEEILTRTDVALVPGSAFGAPGHLRLSFATSMENLEKALERLSRWLR